MVASRGVGGEWGRVLAVVVGGAGDGGAGEGLVVAVAAAAAGPEEGVAGAVGFGVGSYGGGWREAAGAAVGVERTGGSICAVVGFGSVCSRARDPESKDVMYAA